MDSPCRLHFPARQPLSVNILFRTSGKEDHSQALHFLAAISANNRLQVKAQLLAETPQLTVKWFVKQNESKELSVSGRRVGHSRSFFYFAPQEYVNIRDKLARLLTGGKLGL